MFEERKQRWSIRPTNKESPSRWESRCRGKPQVFMRKDVHVRKIGHQTKYSTNSIHYATMVNETGNEVATVTQQTQEPALGDEGNVAGAEAIINARDPTPGQTPARGKSRSTSLCCNLLHRTAPSSARKSCKGTKCQGHARRTEDAGTGLL